MCIQRIHGRFLTFQLATAPHDGANHLSLLCTTLVLAPCNCTHHAFDFAGKFDLTISGSKLETQEFDVCHPKERKSKVVTA